MTEKEQAIALKLRKARALMDEVDIRIQNHFHHILTSVKSSPLPFLSPVHQSAYPGNGPSA
jgi:hypothetical protein